MKRLIPIPPENVEPLKKAQKKEWGYQFVSVNLKDGRHFDSAIASEGHILQVKGHKDVPFEPGDVESVVATDKQWKISLSYHDNLAARRRGQMLLRFGKRFPFLCFVYDGVAPEHGVCAVAGYLHGDSLGNASHNHVAGSCAAKIME